MTSCFGGQDIRGRNDSYRVDDLEDKTQNQTATSGVTNFTGVVNINGAPVDASVDLQDSYDNSSTGRIDVTANTKPLLLKGSTAGGSDSIFKIQDSNSTELVEIDALGYIKFGLDPGVIQNTNGDLSIISTGLLSISTGVGSAQNVQITPDSNIVNFGGSSLSNVSTLTRASNDLNITTTVSGDVSINPAGLIDMNLNTVDNVGILNTAHINAEYTATAEGNHLVELNYNTNSFGDNKVLDIVYNVASQAINTEEDAILISLDKSNAVGGEQVGLAMLATEGNGTSIVLEAGAGCGVIKQLVGTFANPSNGTIDINGSAIAVGSLSGTTMFVADNDYLIVADSAKFEEIEFLLGTVASGSGIAPTFEFSTGTAPLAWTSFSPTDGTNGMRNTGVIAWLNADVPGWITDGGLYKIRITRTRNTLATSPIALDNGIKVAAVVEYGWDLNANITASSLNIGTISCSGAIDMNSNLISEVSDPISAQDAVTLNYFDTKIETAFTDFTGVTVGDGSNNATISNNDSKYYKIGKQVNLAISITLSSLGSASGTIQLSLPSTSVAGSYTGVIGQLSGTALASTTAIHVIVTGVHTTYAKLVYGPNETALTFADISATTLIRGHIVYLET